MIISHRANRFGPNPSEENKPYYIQNAIDVGYIVEVDVWCLGKNLYLGHDKPIYLIDPKFLTDRKYNLICHAKNILALRSLLDINMHCFMHNNDIVTLTSQNYIWTYPGGSLGERSIAVLPENNNFMNREKDLYEFYFDELGCYGVCTDYPSMFKYG